LSCSPWTSAPERPLPAGPLAGLRPPEPPASPAAALPLPQLAKQAGDLQQRAAQLAQQREALEKEAAKLTVGYSEAQTALAELQVKQLAQQKTLETELAIKASMLSSKTDREKVLIRDVEELQVGGRGGLGERLAPPPRRRGLEALGGAWCADGPRPNCCRWHMPRLGRSCSRPSGSWTWCRPACARSPSSWPAPGSR
jgi:hypothetical protein